MAWWRPVTRMSWMRVCRRALVWGRLLACRMSRMWLRRAPRSAGWGRAVGRRAGRGVRRGGRAAGWLCWRGSGPAARRWSRRDCRFERGEVAVDGGVGLVQLGLDGGQFLGAGGAVLVAAGGVGGEGGVDEVGAGEGVQQGVDGLGF